MKRIIHIAVYFMLPYITVSFILWDLHAGNWMLADRVVYVLGAVSIYSVLSILYNKGTSHDQTNTPTDS